MSGYILGFDICSVIILIVLIFSLHLRKMLYGRTNFLFIVFTTIVLLSGITDYATISFPQHNIPSEVNQTILYIINYAYYFSRNLTLPVYILFIYSVYGMWHDLKNSTIRKFIWCAPVSVIIGVLIADFFSHNIFSISIDLTYYRGPWIYVLYAMAFFVMIYSTVFIIKYRDMVTKSKFLVLLSVYPVSMLGILVQMFYPKLLIEIFTTTFSVFLISLIVQRPEEVINYETGCLNYFACIDEFQKNFKLKREMLAVFINITNSEEIRHCVGNDHYRNLQKIIIKELYTNVADDETELYQLDNSTFVLLSLRIDMKNMELIGQQICNLLNQKHSVNNVDVNLKYKLSIAKAPQDLPDLNSVLNFSNTFYKTIVSSNTVTVLHSEMASKDFKIKSEIDEIIKKGISLHNFKIYYQPIYDLNKKKFASAEALIRLFDDKYGYVSPAIFIPAAEKSGAIHQIGEYVLEEVCKFISLNDIEKLGLEYIEVNLSVAQCIEHNFANKIINILKNYRIKPHQINFEITETSEELNPQLFDENIDLLSKNGISFSLDDYGTGYSNIKRIISMPLNIIKLDKSFVDEYQKKEVQIVVKNTVNMLKKMEKHVLVEGIESEKTLKAFTELGCDYIQGFYFSKPIPENDFLMFLYQKNNLKGEN